MPGAVQALVEGRDPPLGSLNPAERAALKTLYTPGGYAPLWLDPNGRPTTDAHDALSLLDAAPAEGLDPVAYLQTPLGDLVARLGTGAPTLSADLARFDVTLSLGTLRYLHDLHLGRVDPKTLGFRLSVPADQHDFVALLRTALTEHRIKETAADLRPPFEQYLALQSMLGRYRMLAAGPGLELPPAGKTPVRPGDAYPAADALRRRLTALGDLPQGAPAPADPARYGDDLAAGVKRFQVRHGLDADGVLGKSTLAALRVPLSWRVRQIELALERLRWVPDLDTGRLVAINIPMFRLWSWDVSPPKGAPSLGMGVIVGRALRTQTPVFVEQMREVIFRPYWNVPRSILRNETLPHIASDPDYLRREDMEIVRGPGDDAQPVEATTESIEGLRMGALRLRQRPGPRNSLGLVKFVFPNDENVYMHATPAQALFAKSRRDFSHGCVRLEDPVALAEWVLQDQPEWNREAILAAMAGSKSIHVKLKRPIQVVLFYTTAAVMPDDGTIGFAEDIYGHDQRLNAALAAPRAAR